MSATLLYGLREALATVCSEGLEKTIERHRKCAEELRIGLNELGLELYVQNAANRLPTITSVKIPKEIDWKKIVEIGANEYVPYINEVNVSNRSKRICNEGFCFPVSKKKTRKQNNLDMLLKLPAV